MSLLAIVTFDLHGAPTDSYSRVKKRLSGLTLEAEIESKKSDIPTRLPSNTFAAKFGRGSSKNALELRDYLKKGVKRIVRDEGLRATIFVAVGDDWAWGKGKV